MSTSRTLVVGALGVIGRAVIEHLEDLGRPAVGMSRRQPPVDQRTTSPHLVGDITDADGIADLADQLSDVTHLVFAAYQEHRTLDQQIAPNMALLSGALDAMRAAKAPLEHVTLYQGNKYYGAHLGPFKTPAYESDPRLPGPNFYYDQEDLLRARAAQDDFHFTLLRPEAVCGIASGNPMNLLTAIAVYGTLCREARIPYRFTGPAAADAHYQVTDARLLARATVWAGHAPAAYGQAFNVTNGDQFRWREMSKRIAAYFGIDCAPAQQLDLADHMPSHEPVWMPSSNATACTPPPTGTLPPGASLTRSSTAPGTTCPPPSRSARQDSRTASTARRCFYDQLDELVARRLIPLLEGARLSGRCIPRRPAHWRPS